jgi:hypothetical protein
LIANHTEQIKKLEETVESLFNVEDYIGDSCPYADFTEFVIKTHLNSGKAIKDEFTKLD